MNEEPWAKSIPSEIEEIDLEVLVQLWHVRFQGPVQPHEVKRAGDFYYQASRRLWKEKLLTKVQHEELDPAMGLGVFETFVVADHANSRE